MEKIEPRKMNLNLVKTALKIGAFAGVASIAYMACLHLLGQHAFGKFKYMYIAIYGFFFGYAAWSYRVQFGNFKFREGVFMGFTLNLLATALFIGGLYLLMQHTALGQEMLSLHQSKLMEIWERANALHQSKELTELSAEELQYSYGHIKNMKASDLALEQVSFFHGIGIFHTLLATLLLKR